MALANITRTDGKQNIPGAKIKLDISYASAITTWPELDAAPADDVAEVTIAGDFVSPTLTPFKTFDFTPDSTKIDGSKKGAHYELKYSGKIFLPNDAEGTGAEAQLKKLTNSRLAVKIPLQNGAVKLAGESYDRPATMTAANYTSGKLGEDGTVEVEVEFTWYSVVPGGAYFTGDLTVE